MEEKLRAANFKGFQSVFLTLAACITHPGSLGPISYSKALQDASLYVGA